MLTREIKGKEAEKDVSKWQTDASYRGGNRAARARGGEMMGKSQDMRALK